MIYRYYSALEPKQFCDSVDAANLALWQTNLVIHRRGPNPVCHRAKCNEIVMELNDIYLDRGLLKYRSFGYAIALGCCCITMVAKPV